MSVRKTFILALVAIITGLALIITNHIVTSRGIVIAAAVLFAGCGIIALLASRSMTPVKPDTPADADTAAAAAEPDKRAGRRSAIARIAVIIAGSGACLLGLAMLIFTATFASGVAAFFALLAILCAIAIYLILAIGTRPHILPGWLYILPTVIVGAAIYLFTLQPVADDRTIMVVTGSAVMLFGITAALIALLLRSARRAYAATPAKAASATAAPASQTPAVRTIRHLDE
ncbi:MAG: hypothetical protein ACI30W_05450 [Muribaculaceae bacterium]